VHFKGFRLRVHSKKLTGKVVETNYGFVRFGHCEIYEPNYLYRKCFKPVTIQYLPSDQASLTARQLLEV